MIVFELQISSPGKAGFVFNALFKTSEAGKQIAERHSKVPLEWKPAIHPQTEYAIASTPPAEVDATLPQGSHTIYYIAPREVIEVLPP